MKMPKSIDENMFAPCGMNCLLCHKHLESKKPCLGCLKEDGLKPKHCIKCKIKECVKTNKIFYCYECEKHPCAKIKNLEKSYNSRYKVNLTENSLFVKEHSLSEFMQSQKEKYSCPVCGGIISIHSKKCSECFFEIDK